MTKRSLIQNLTLVTAIAVVGLSSLGVLGYVRAYQQIRSFPGAEVEWSGFIVPLVFVLLQLVVSVVGALGMLFAPSRHLRTFATVFVVGVLAAICGRWLAVVFGVLRGPGVASVVVSLLTFAWFAFLAVALRPNYAFKPTAGEVSGSSEPPGPAAA
jgi:hypothetical protein